MKKTKTFRDFEKIGENFYKSESHYFRLFAFGITPNGCWLIAPQMVEVTNIDIATGKDVYGGDVFSFDICGTVQAHNCYIMRTDRK